MNQKENFLKGFVKENPLLVSMLGMCPSLAVTTRLENAIGMGIAVLFVLVLSNLLISLIMSHQKLGEWVKPVRIPVYIVVIATLVTMVDMLMNAFLPDIHKSLGMFIPLIVVNCIILGRAEAFASENKPLDSVVDGVSMALGFTFAIVVISVIREVLGNGTITVWGDVVLNMRFIFDFLNIQPIDMFVKPVGAFLTFGFLLAGVAAITNHRASKKVGKVAKS
ncbi:MAG: electron transport complex subunit E [Candidatus Izemoplasmatales bacterium]|nr:electron transport complex subunit E [Candidatus Izemoplasmatales bacterium]